MTRLDESISERISALVVDGRIDIFAFIPGKLGEVIEDTGIGSIEVNVAHFTNTCMLVLSFALIVLTVMIIAAILRHRLKRDRQEKNLIGTVDSSVGLLVGMIKGVILVFVFLAFMFPVAGVFMPEKIHAINETLNHSFIAGPLYDVNPLILFVRKLPF